MKNKYTMVIQFTKKNNKYYLFLGYDDLLEYEIYIPIIYNNSEINIMKLVDYQKELSEFIYYQKK